MPDALDSLSGLNDCGGCAGISAETPVRVENRPGLDQFPYRVGTHARFLESMLTRLSGAGFPALEELSTRLTDDLTIAFLDACAVVDDGLTFYTERYANEWFVRTARERISLVQMARLIGYEPGPGVAANAYLAFTIDDTPGSPDKTTIEAGTKVLSIPGKDELPQFFETGATIEARSAWNAMKARTRQPQLVSKDMEVVFVQGIENGLRRGDRLLVVVTDEEGNPDTKEMKRITRVFQEPEAGRTRLELRDAPKISRAPKGWHSPGAGISGPGQVLTNVVFDEILAGSSFSNSDIVAINKIYNWHETYFTVAANSPKATEPAVQGVYALRQRAAAFGHNAPSWANLPQIVEGQNRQYVGRVLSRLNAEGNTSFTPDKWQYPTDWDNLNLVESNTDPDGSYTPGRLDLDNIYPAAIGNSWIVLENPAGAARAFQVFSNQETTRADYTLSVKVTRLVLASAQQADLQAYKMRDVTIYAQSEQLPLADVPVEGDVEGDSVLLAQYYPGLVKGQLVIVSGERTDLRGVIDHEVRVLKDVLMNGSTEPGRYFTELLFTEPLAYHYVPETVTVNANVAAATHGETKTETLGGGSSDRYQTFTLKQAPLTYVSAPTPSGVQSTLEVRVNEILWKEVESLYGRPPDERVYVIRHEDDGKTRVQFNAPVPGGAENVKATYRVGIGLPGQVKAGQLSLLAVKPLGVRSVKNPLAASGAEDRESIDDLRENSPLTVLTLGRLVSLQDYEDFARAFAGFSKALATPTTDGAQNGIFLTVAGETGPVSEDSPEFDNLVGAIERFGDPFVRLVVKPYRQAFFQVEGSVEVAADYLPELVLEEVKAALAGQFGFARRHFGQPVTQAEVIATMQNVPGVVSVTLKYLFRSDPFNPGLAKSLQNVLLAAQPEPGDSRFAALAAELLTLDPRPILITAVSL